MLSGRLTMRRVRWLCAMTAAMSLAITTGSVASAGGTTAVIETRGAFIEQLMLQLGIKPVFPTTPTFSDVPPTNPYYGYVEAAEQAGIANGFAGGTFGPNLGLTRAQAAKYEVIASGHGATATVITSTKFTDNATIPTALVGYVAEASTLGLLKGFPNGEFLPNAYLTIAEEKHLLVQLAVEMNATSSPVTLDVSASADNASTGQFVTLSAEGSNSQGATVATSSVTYSVISSDAQNAIIAGSTFVASQPGTYTVQGTMGTATGEVTITVYGPPAALRVTAPKALVADGTSQQTITVSVVDQAGNVVANNSDTISLTSGNIGSVEVVGSNGALGATATASATNGVATFTVQAGSVLAAATALVAADQAETAISGSTSIATSAQVATAVSVSAPNRYLTANGVSTQVVDVAVVDQADQPMLYGTYNFSVSLAGPATFVDGTTTPHTFVYDGNASAADFTPVPIEDVQGETGTVTVAISSGTLAAAQTTLTAVIAGAAAGLQITPPMVSSFSEDSISTGIAFGIQAVDSHGYPVPDNVPLELTVRNAHGAIATNIQVDHLSQTTSAGVLDSAALENGSFTVTDEANGADAGTYTITVTDPSDSLSAPSPVTFDVTPGAAYGIDVSRPAYVSTAAPSAQVTAQVVDRYGNPIADSGLPVTFSTSGTGISPASAVVDTGASGSAIETFALPANVGVSYPVTVSVPLNGTTAATANFTMTVESSVASSIRLTLQDTATAGPYANNGSAAQAGDLVKLTIEATNQNGLQVPTADKLLISSTGVGTLTNPSTALAPGGGVGTVTDNGNGTWTVTLADGLAVFAARAQAAGPVTLAATDQSVAPAATGVGNFTVLPGSVTGFELVDASGEVASGETVVANIPLPLTLRPIDFAGNMAVPSANYIVALQGQTSGSFRSTPSGADLHGVPVYAGSAVMPIYYVSGTSASDVSLSANDWLSYPANSSLTVANGASLDFATSGGTLEDATDPADLSGLTFTAPVTGSGQDTIDFVASGVTLFSFQLNW